jgi:hypothetical protein
MLHSLALSLSLSLSLVSDAVDGGGVAEDGRCRRNKSS